MINESIALFHLLVESRDALFLSKDRGILNTVGKEVVDLSKAEVLAIVVSFRHFILVIRVLEWG